MIPVTVVGAGLAGCEAAWQLANRGAAVTLMEMKPDRMTPAHHSPDFAELVCSNSLRADRLENAVGLLKEELRHLGSLILACADAHRVEAGGALAVDRAAFAAEVTKRITAHPRIAVSRREVTAIPAGGPCIIATGPLTSDALASDIVRYFGTGKPLSFYDAAAPIVTAASVDMTRAWYASRYDKGGADYINCDMTREEYAAFHTALCSAEEASVHGFEDTKIFEGCMPVEVMARRGTDTLRYGPLKPKGLRHPETGRMPWAVVQLRRDNADGTLLNLVGFQTHLKFGEQKRVFSMIPALRSAEFVRFGVMHRNTYLDSPRLLGRYYEVRSEPRLCFAGQMTGVEGYVESAASGALAAIELFRRSTGKPPVDFPKTTALGALAHYISDETIKEFQPMNVNFGIIPPLSEQIRGKRDRNTALSARALAELAACLRESGENSQAGVIQARF